MATGRAIREFAGLRLYRCNTATRQCGTDPLRYACGRYYPCRNKSVVYDDFAHKRTLVAAVVFHLQFKMMHSGL